MLDDVCKHLETCQGWGGGLCIEKMLETETNFWPLNGTDIYNFNNY